MLVSIEQKNTETVLPSEISTFSKCLKNNGLKNKNKKVL